MLSLLFIAFSAQEIIFDCNTNRPGIVLSVYYQEWCSACKKYEPTLVNMATNAAVRNVPVTIQKVNCDKCDCDSVNIRSYPTTILRENGVELGRFSGAVDCSYVGNFMNTYLCNKSGTLSSIGNESSCGGVPNPANQNSAMVTNTFGQVCS
jgi:thioredoxin domain-containing protein 5